MIEKISLGLFGGLVEPYIEYFDELKLKLKQARMLIDIKTYVCNLLFIALIVYMISLPIASFFIGIVTMAPSYSFTLSIIVSLFASLLAFLAGNYYPSMKAKGIENRIMKELPFVSVYMSTIASSNVNPVEIFKLTSLKKGEIGNECKRIYRDVAMLGMDLPSAIAKAANRTPSAKFSEFLWGMVSVLTRGGDLGRYFEEKTREFMGDYRRSLDKYSRQVSFFTEIYITLIIVGSVFFIVLSSIMGPLSGGGILLIQTFLVFVFIPLVSIGFIVLFKGMSPTE
ncbi:MAG: hypothetical protein DRP03_00210 [Candidatus Aenigmatarchaeota archaeon]|nr:MAG: hypothetical protein DRP03_00210 [Candidatus Aenigmarchaeota archaeon]